MSSFTPTERSLRTKFRYFRYTWKDAVNQKEAVEPEMWCDQALDAVKKLWEGYKDLGVPLDNMLGDERARSTTTTTTEFDTDVSPC